MSFLAGASAIGSGIGALSSIANALFPKQILIRINRSDLNLKSVDVNIDAMESATTNTAISISEQPAENAKVFAQNIYRQPRTITLQCILSNILRASNVKSLSSAAQFGSSLLIPEVASITNLAINEEDSIAIRLKHLRNAQQYGRIVQIIGLPDQDVFNFIVENVSDTENVKTGAKAKAVDILVKEVFIVGLDAPTTKKTGGLFSKITGAITGAINSLVPKF